MLTQAQLNDLKVGDMLLDLTTNKAVKVCGCLFVVVIASAMYVNTQMSLL